MKINVGIEGKGYCFIDVDITIDEYDNRSKYIEVHKKIMNAIKEKYGACSVIGYCPAEKNIEVLEGK